jgi:hypothetical protein
MASVASTAESANAKRAEAIAQFRSTKTQSTAKVQATAKNEAANEAANEAKQPETPVNIDRKERKENNEDRKEQSKVAAEQPTQSGKNEAQKKALLQSLRRKKAQKDKATAAARAYRSNLSKGKGNAETNMAGLERKLAEAKSLQAEIAKVEFEITNLG